MPAVCCRVSTREPSGKAINWNPVLLDALKEISGVVNTQAVQSRLGDTHLSKLSKDYLLYVEKGITSFSFDLFRDVHQWPVVRGKEAIRITGIY